MESSAPNDVQVNFRAPRELRKALRLIAASQDRDVGVVLLQIAQEYVDEQTAAA
jgi:hypothetical protein